MYISELSHDQIVELKQNYLAEHFQECENRCLSWGELADVDEIVDDQLIYDAYSDMQFTNDDFFCSADSSYCISKVFRNGKIETEDYESEHAAWETWSCMNDRALASDLQSAELTRMNWYQRSGESLDYISYDDMEE
jgi:hypothetical protein